LIRERNDRVSQAYLTASLVRTKADRFPKLDKLLIKPNARKAVQDPEARWRSLVSASKTKH
jgi:hypothetical protein